MENDGTLPEAALSTEEKHVLLDKADAVTRGLLSAKDKNFCAYKFCPHAEGLKRQKCGEAQARTQAGRPRAPLFCAHPKCNRAFHALCHSIVHRLVSREKLRL